MGTSQTMISATELKKCSFKNNAFVVLLRAYFIKYPGKKLYVGSSIPEQIMDRLFTESVVKEDTAPQGYGKFIYSNGNEESYYAVYSDKPTDKQDKSLDKSLLTAIMEIIELNLRQKTLMDEREVDICIDDNLYHELVEEELKQKGYTVTKKECTNAIIPQQTVIFDLSVGYTHNVFTVHW